MSLYTKCILHSSSPEDGTRISVMSRHTLNDGITIDTRITSDLYHEHLPNLGPPSKLIGDYYKRDLSWEMFEERYLSYLHTPKILSQVKDLAQRATLEDITLLCIEETPEHCHRRLLAEECQRYQHSLKVEHR